MTFETGIVRVAALIAASALLSACGQSSVRPDATGAQSPTTGQAASSAAKSTRRGGAYYKDDGPDDVPPDNLALVPDAVPRLEPLHRFANRPYSVFGKEYVPATELAPYRERGLASWYGRRFHGQPTSSGEPYDMYAMTAAHPTLPIPSYARVTNVATRQSVVVRINDRGPFHDDRVMDLSYTAAFKLGYINRGSAEVEIEQILPGAFDSSSMAKRGDGPAAPVVRKSIPSAVNPAADVAVVRQTQPLTPLAAATSGVFLQLGAFSSVDNAEGFRAAIEREMSAFAERLELLADGDRVRLHAGPYASVDEARRVADRIASTMKVKPFVVLR
ncbi:septal ring lytic transglycosylase RlpA family protein [Azoarcus sp. L1K30]|nr:septal ring lytic transglycosylase RlpA family protein [Azoarcus sp. L1K30]